MLKQVLGSSLLEVFLTPLYTLLLLIGTGTGDLAPLLIVGESVEGVSPVVATVIIVSIAIAVALWISGTTGAMMQSGEQLRIMPYSNITVDPGAGTAMLALYVKNTGSGDIIIDRIELGGKIVTGTPSVSGDIVNSVDGIVVPANGEGWMIYTDPSIYGIKPNEKYNIMLIRLMLKIRRMMILTLIYILY